jgi:hypothetical protein
VQGWPGSMHATPPQSLLMHSSSQQSEVTEQLAPRRAQQLFCAPHSALPIEKPQHCSACWHTLAPGAQMGGMSRHPRAFEQSSMHASSE